MASKAPDAAAIVDLARSGHSPIREAFEWDDEKAAIRYQKEREMASKAPVRSKNGQVATEEDIAAVVRKIELPPLEEHHAIATLKGLSPLIQHRFTEKARKMMEAKQTGKASRARELRDPDAEAMAAAYVIPGREELADGTPGKYCHPASAFKHAFLFGVAQLDDKTKFPKSRATGWFFVTDDPILQFEKMETHADIGRIGSGTAQNVYRPYFYDWSFELEFDYNTISLEQAVSLLDRGGRQGGIGEQRPSAPKNKTGSNGRFYVEHVEDLG